jgi:hypothetical protein
MNADRWGYFRNGYHYWPDIVAGAEFYGFDRSDPIYKERHPRGRGIEGCPACGIHPATERNFPCDVAMARASDMEAAGISATFCRKCSREMPVRLGQSEWLPTCFRCEKHEANRRSPRTHSDGGVRIPDGYGCSEKVPAWMLDPNEGRGW